MEATPTFPTGTITPLATRRTPTELTPVPEVEEEEPPFQPDGEQETIPGATTTEHHQAPENDEEEEAILPLEFVARLREVQELAARGNDSRGWSRR